MDKILEIITRYNFFNYLLPWVIFIVYVNTLYFDNYIANNNTIILLFVAYFLGLLMSRVWSLLIEPFFKKLNWIEWREYSLFIWASQKDEKINVFVSEANMYRTLISLSIVCFLYTLYLNLVFCFFSFGRYFLCIITIIIFILSYKKQNKYIVERIDIYEQHTNI